MQQQWRGPQVARLTPGQLCSLILQPYGDSATLFLRLSSLTAIIQPPHSKYLFSTSWLTLLMASASSWFYVLLASTYCPPWLGGTQICFCYQLLVSFPLLPAQILERENLLDLASNYRPPYRPLAQWFSNVGMKLPRRFIKTQIAQHHPQSFLIR